MGIGRSDNLPVTEMGLSDEIVKVLHKKDITGWDELTCQTFGELAAMGLSPEQVTQVSDAVNKNLQ